VKVLTADDEQQALAVDDGSLVVPYAVVDGPDDAGEEDGHEHLRHLRTKFMVLVRRP
jgi:hypothetical protein